MRVNHAMSRGWITGDMAFVGDALAHVLHNVVLRPGRWIGLRLVDERGAPVDFLGLGRTEDHTEQKVEALVASGCRAERA